MDAAAVHRFSLLELVDPDDALAASAAALAAAARRDPADPWEGDPEAERQRLARLAVAAVAARRRGRIVEQLLQRRGPRRAGEDPLGPLRGRERTVLALEAGAGLSPPMVAEVLDVHEGAVLAARERALGRLGEDAAALRRRAAHLGVPAGELGARVAAALARRAWYERLDPGRLAGGRRVHPLAIAALIAAVAGVAGSAGLLGQRPHAPAARGPVTAQVDAARSGPPARAFAAAGYDPVRGQTVLFGGRAAENRLLDDTWTWDGSAWQRQHTTRAPSLRKAAAMAWDGAAGRLLLFGGEGPVGPGEPDSALRDTWAWNGSDWTPLATATAPPARMGAGTAALATDATTGEVLLVGDGARQGTSCSLATWHWHGGAWSELRPATAPRSALTGRLAYAPGTGGLVLVTALPTASACGGVARDAAVWTWNGATWNEQHPVTALAAKHVVDGQLAGSVVGVMIPGYHTFSWDGSDWHDGGADGPGARFGAAVAYDERRRQSVLFGGCCIVGGHDQSVYDDTWTWDGGTWLRRGGSQPAEVAATTAAPASPWVRTQLPLGSVDAVIVDGGAVYAIVERLGLGVVDPDRAMVVRVDRTSGSVTSAGPFPAADSLALADGVLWVGAGVHPGIDNPGGLALYGLDPSTLDVRHELALAAPAGLEQFSARLAGLGGRLWMGFGDEVIGIDPRTGTAVRRLPLAAGQSVDDLVLDPSGGRLYTSVRLPTGDALVSVRDPATGAVRAAITEHSTAGARLAAGTDGVWISAPTGLSSELHHRGAADLRLLGTPPVLSADGEPSGDTLRAFLTGGLLWIADAQRSTLSCADPHTGAVRATAAIGRAHELAGDAGGLYLGTSDGVLVIAPDLRCAG